MRIFIAILVRVGLPLIFLGAIYWFLTVGIRPEVPVREVSRGVAVDAVAATITVNPAFSMTLTSDVDGRVSNSAFSVGDRVARGDFLLEIDSTDLELDYERFRVEYESLRSELELTLAEEVEEARMREDLENFERQFAEGTLSKIEIERKRQDFELFQEEVEAKRLENQRRLRNMEVEDRQWQRKLEQTRIHAPVDGIITEVFAYPSELLRGGSPVARIFSRELQIEARINEEDFAGVQVGQSARIRFLTYGGRIFDGTVARVLPTADPETQQYTVYLELDTDEDLLLPGLTGEASIIRDRRDDTLIVPRRALLGRFVFVVEDNTVALREVVVGFRGLNDAEILDGLEEGEWVITDDQDRVRDGDVVRPLRPEL